MIEIKELLFASIPEDLYYYVEVVMNTAFIL